VQLSVYPTIRDAAEGMKQFLDAFPDALKAIFRMEDYVSGPGYLGAELFSLTLPLIFLTVGSSWGAAATAEDEENGTADLLLTLPFSRLRVWLCKSAALVGVLIGMGTVIYVVLRVGSLLVDMEIDSMNLAAGVVACLLLGYFFSSLAGVAGASMGKKGAALGVSIGVAIASFVLYSLAPLVDTFDVLLPLNPFEWAIGGKPLVNGFQWFDLGVLLILSFGLNLIAVRLFVRRDIRI
jgi:ABC-2 type transport system permease protein